MKLFGFLLNNYRNYNSFSVIEYNFYNYLLNIKLAQNFVSSPLYSDLTTYNFFEYKNKELLLV